MACKGKLFSIEEDGTHSLPPVIINNEKLMIGRSESCKIRIDENDAASEHCAIFFDEEGQGFMEPVNKCGFTFLNGKLIEKKTILEHGDIITVVKRSFCFCYPTSSKFYVEKLATTSFQDSIYECKCQDKLKTYILSQKVRQISLRNKCWYLKNMMTMLQQKVKESEKKAEFFEMLVECATKKLQEEENETSDSKASGSQ